MKKLTLILGCGLLASGCSFLSQQQPQQQQLQLEQQYIVEWIGERPLIDRSHLSISLQAEGKAGGFAGCNNWFASYQLSGSQLALEQIATTRKVCAPSLMEQEQRYLEALSQIVRWDFGEHGQLQLWPQQGAPIRLWPDTSPDNN